MIQIALPKIRYNQFFSKGGKGFNAGALESEKRMRITKSRLPILLALILSLAQYDNPANQPGCLF